MAKPASSFARRVLFGCWLLVLSALLAVPALRQLALLQSQGSSLMNERDFATPSVARLAIVPLPQPAQVDALEWMRRHPELPIAQVDAAYEIATGGGGGNSAQMWRSFDQVIARFPNEAWLYTARLRYTFGEFPGLGQTMVDSENTTGSSTSAKVPPPNELAKSLEVARRGGELEPDNAFFDICAALLHIQAGRSDLAVRSLKAAGRKKEFNEYVGKESWARIENGRMKGPRTFEGEMAISASMLFPQYAVMREGARRFVARGRDLEAQGKHEEALEIYGALMSIGRNMNQGETIITSLVGRAIVYIGMARGRKAPTPPNPLPHGIDSRNLTRQLRAQSFAAYANAHGRADLARAAQEDLRVDAALMQAGRKYLDSRYYGGIPNELMAKTTSLWSIGAALLLQLVLGLAVLIPLSTWRSRQAPEERREVSPLDVASAVLPPLFAVAACAWMIWHRREMDWAGWQTLVEEQTTAPASTLLAWAIALAPLPFIAVWCAVGSAWSRRARSREENQDAGRSSDARSARNYAEGRDEILVKRVGALVLGLGWVMLSGLALAALLIPDDGSSGSTVILVRWLLPVEGLMVLALHLFLRRQAAEHATRRADSPNAAHTARIVAAQRSGSNALERARRALCWSTALAAVAWVALATASLPLRNEAQARLDNFVQNGEMSLVRRDAGMQP